MRNLLSLLFLLTTIHFGFSQAEWTSVQERNLVELRKSLEPAPTLPKISSWLAKDPVWSTNSYPSQKPANLAASPVPAAWKYQDLALFCKLEVKLEKALKLPIKVRLGEVQAVERKEGKLKTYFAEQQ